MTTSWNDTQQIEAHLTGQHDTGNALLFEAKLMIDPSLAEKVAWQKRTYSLVRQYGRKALKNEIEAVHQALFSKPEHSGFAGRIRRIFGKK